MLLFSEDVSNTYTKTNCSFCHSLPVSKKKKGISESFVSWKVVASLSYTCSAKLCQKVHENTELFCIAHAVCAETSLPLQTWLLFCHPFLSSTWRARRVWSSEGRYIYRDILFCIPFFCTNSQFLLGSQKFRLEIRCLFCAEINFLYLYSPLKIHMLVSDSGGCHYPKFQSNQLSQVLPLTVTGCSTLHCAEPFTQCLQSFRSFLGPGSLKASTSVSWADLWLGWQVKPRLKTFLQIEAFLELISFSSAIRLTMAHLLKLLFENRLILLDAADCCEIQRCFCLFLEKNDISVCLPFRLSQLVWNCVGLVKSTERLLGGVTIPSFLVLSVQLRCLSYDHLQCWLNLLFLALTWIWAAFTGMPRR